MRLRRESERNVPMNQHRHGLNSSCELHLQPQLHHHFPPRFMRTLLKCSARPRNQTRCAPRNGLETGSKMARSTVTFRVVKAEALKQAQSIAKEEQAKNLTIAATSEKKAKSLAIAAASRATGVPRKTIKRHLAADLTGGVAHLLYRNAFAHVACIAGT